MPLYFQGNIEKNQTQKKTCSCAFGGDVLKTYFKYFNFLEYKT